MRGNGTALTDANSMSRRTSLALHLVLRQAWCLERPPDKPLIRAVTAFSWPPVDPLRVLDAVRDYRACIVVTIAVPQAAVVHHSLEDVLIPLCRTPATE